MWRFTNRGLTFALAASDACCSMGAVRRILFNLAALAVIVILSPLVPARGAAAVCDADHSGAVDLVDIQAIAAARGQPASPGDPRDVNADGLINVNDSRKCVLACALPRCAPVNPLAIDNDGDGFAENDGDCDDARASAFPGAPELPGNGIDEDCDGSDLVATSCVSVSPSDLRDREITGWLDAAQHAKTLGFESLDSLLLCTGSTGEWVAAEYSSAEEGKAVFLLYSIGNAYSFLVRAAPDGAFAMFDEGGGLKIASDLTAELVGPDGASPGIARARAVSGNCHEFWPYALCRLGELGLEFGSCALAIEKCLAFGPGTLLCIGVTATEPCAELIGTFNIPTDLCPLPPDLHCDRGSVCSLSDECSLGRCVPDSPDPAQIGQECTDASPVDPVCQTDSLITALLCSSQGECIEGVQSCPPGTICGDRRCGSCGDDVPDPILGEQCDNGAGNSDTGRCTTECRNAVCGDGLIREGVEACDGSNLDGSTCQSLGLRAGTLACAGGCGTFDLSGCEYCGNGRVEPSAEDCDPGANPNCTPECNFPEKDNDEDGLGNSEDPDDDDDGISDASDPNPIDHDDDGIRDSADPDDDDDGISDGEDALPKDHDNDGIPDRDDPDDDNDGIPDAEDEHPRDQDNDGIPDRDDPPSGESWGDPHLVTFDRLAYDFQAVGEFVLVRSTEDDLAAQIRTRPWRSSRFVSVNSAVAMQIAGDRVAVYLDRTPALYINGVPTALNDSRTELPGGGSVDVWLGVVVVTWPDTSQVEVRNSGSHLNLMIALPATRRDRVEGLLGNFDGDRGNELVTSAGELIVANPSYDELYRQYGESWRITEDESLFDYFDGNTTVTHTDPTFPGGIVTPLILSDDARLDAEAICASAGVKDPVLLEACVLDVGITGDSSFAEFPATLSPPRESIQLAQGTIFLESEGDPGRFVIEAEAFSGREVAPQKDWLVVPDESSGFPALFLNSRGDRYIQALPDNNSGGGGGGPRVPPYVDYTLRIDTPGTYRLFVRWAAHGDNSDTFYASIVEAADGPGGSIADWYRYIRISDAGNFAISPTWFGSAGFERTDSPASNGETAAVWSIATPGVYTLRLSMREDGAAIDAFVLQLTSMPSPTGDGPETTPVLGTPGPNPPG